MDACDRTFSVVKACILLRKRKTFIECEVDPSGVIEAMLQLILLYVW